MPRVLFAAENVTVDVPAGTSILAAARQGGVEIFRGFWCRDNLVVRLVRRLLCEGRGLCAACEVWAAPGAAGALSAPSFFERLRYAGGRSTKRLACSARIAGDVEIRTRPGGPGPARSLDAYERLRPAPTADAPTAPAADAAGG